MPPLLESSLRLRRAPKYPTREELRENGSNLASLFWVGVGMSVAHLEAEFYKTFYADTRPRSNSRYILNQPRSASDVSNTPPSLGRFLRPSDGLSPPEVAPGLAICGYLDTTHCNSGSDLAGQHCRLVTCKLPRIIR